eukprot:GFYU01003941.1.p2 GENE.GFYU01003941.1~~GFYU01003941.1.p2  ORF type:complete len:695 (+),score=263.15 GFYU01003941.1:52-2136(+)
MGGYNQMKDGPGSSGGSASMSKSNNPVQDRQLTLQMEELRSGRDWDYMVIFEEKIDPATNPEYKGEELEAANKRYAEQKKILHGIRQSGLIMEKGTLQNGDDLYIRISAPHARLEEEADRIDYNCQLKEKYGGGFTSFKVSKRDFFLGRDENEQEFAFRKVDRIRLVKSIIEAKRRDHGAGVNLASSLTNGTVKQAFALHENVQLNALAEIWASKWFRPQPLDAIRAYFGEKIALYFAWLGFYTKWLISPSLVGLILFMFSITQGVNNPLVPSYCVIMALWSTFFLEFWKREQVTYSVRWGMTEFEEEEQARPEFYGEEVISPVTNKKEVVYPKKKKVAKVAFSSMVITLLVAVVIIAVCGIFLFRMIVKHMEPWGPALAGMVNAIQIQILNAIYGKVAFKLNKWENHRTDTEYEDALIGKIFLFQFVNSYNALFYIAFFKSQADLFGHQDSCKKGDCLSELFTQVLCLLGTKIFVGNFTEVFIPYLKRKMKLRAERKARGGDDVVIPPAEYQATQTPFTSTFDDFSEMVIQFGYVTLFVVAFPLAPFLALVNNIVEIRADAYKLCNEYQRPFPTGAEDIGTWYYILEIMSTMAVITNCAIFAFTTKALEDYDGVTKLAVFVISEHIILLVKYTIAFVVNDVPSATMTLMERQTFGVRKHIFGEEDDDDFGMLDGAYTSSDDEEEPKKKGGSRV